jgi:hypothetical protein
MLDLVDEAFDQVAFLVEVLVMRDGLLSRGFGRNDRVGTEGEISPDPIGVDDAASSKAPHSGSLPRFWNLESRSDSNGNLEASVRSRDTIEDAGRSTRPH